MEFISTLLQSVATLGTSLAIFFSGIVATYAPNDTVLPSLPYTETPSALVAENSAAASSTTPEIEENTPSATPEPTVTTASTTPSNSTTTPTTLKPSISAEELNTLTRASLVNILCLPNTDKINPVSGSGVFVTANGVVLTNAHVGQFFLLKDYPQKNDVECVLRTGSPAKATYHAKILYLPPAWIEKSAAQITTKVARGTGENDYAFLLVTDMVDENAEMPKTFPALPMTLQEPTLNDSMLLAAYPASFLDGAAIEHNLYITSAYAAVTKLFTFGEERDVDLVSIGGTVVSQGGSSGGATVRARDGRLQGIITTATTAETTAGRDLRTITLAHINRSLKQYGEGGLETLLSQNMRQAADDFEDTFGKKERQALITALEAE